MLKEIPAGRKVSLEISRDGNMQTLAVQLADRKAMEHEVWNKIGTDGRRLGAALRGWAFWPAEAMRRCRAASTCRSSAAA